MTGKNRGFINQPNTVILHLKDLPVIRRIPLLCVCVLSFYVPVKSHADIVTWLDFTNFQTRLNEAAAVAGVSNFTVLEREQIEDGIRINLETMFGGFDITFQEANPGGTYETIDFNQTASPGAYGQANGIDFRNQRSGETARVFSGNFGTFIESGESRSQQIQELTMALSGTADHELGHNFGLEHGDSYSDITYTQQGIGVNTGGVQNSHIMATGSTGLTEPGRETLRDWSGLSTAKLEYAEGLTGTDLPPIMVPLLKW